MTVLSSSTNTRVMSLPLASNTPLTSIGGGAGAEATDSPAAFFYVSDGQIYRKVTSATGAGFGYTNPTTHDMTTAAKRTAMMKINCTDFGGLQSTNGLRVRIGSASGSEHEYVAAGSLAKIPVLQKYPAKGGFIIVPIDVNIAAYREVAGTPVLTAVDWFALVGAFASASAKAENIGYDNIDLGTGLELHTSGNLVDFVSHDEGIVTNRFGYAFTQGSDNYALFGTMFVGRNAGVTAAVTISDDTRETYEHLDGLFQAGWSGWLFDLGNVSTSITLGNKTFKSSGSTSVEDSRGVFNVTGTAGVFTLNSCGWINQEHVTLNSKMTLNSPTIVNVETIPLAGAIIDKAIISGSPVASNVAMLTTTNDIDNVTDADITSGGTGHFADIQTAGTYDWDGNILSGYGGTPGSNLVASSGDPDAALLNSSGGLVTLNVVNGASVPSIRNTAGSTTSVVAAVSYELTGLDIGADVTIVDITTPAAPVELFNEIAGVEGVVTYSFDGALSGTAIGVYIRNTTIENNEFDDVLPAANISFKPSQDDDNVYSNP